MASPTAALAAIVEWQEPSWVSFCGMVVDAHMHQWDPYTSPRATSVAAKVIRRAPIALPLLLKLLSKADREFVGDPQYALRPYLPADYLADGAPAGVDTVVHIEAAWKAKRPFDFVAETRWVAGLPFGQHGAPVLGAIRGGLSGRRISPSTSRTSHLGRQRLDIARCAG